MMAFMWIQILTELKIVKFYLNVSLIFMITPNKLMIDAGSLRYSDAGEGGARHDQPPFANDHLDFVNG